MVSDLLRLKAQDEEDLQVVSSCLQDALTRVADMTYLPRLQRFALVATRFRWERHDDPRREGGERIRAGVHFDGVLKVRTQGIDMSDRAGLLPILAISPEANDDGYLITITFAAGGAVQLQTEYIDCRLSDIGEGWPTPNRPDHGS